MAKTSEACPCSERKSALKRILRNTKHNRIRFTDYIIGDGLALFAELEQRNLEGVIPRGSLLSTPEVALATG